MVKGAMEETRHHYRSCLSPKKDRRIRKSQKESLQIGRRSCKSPQKESPQKESLQIHRRSCKSLQKESPQKRRQSRRSHSRNLLPYQMMTKHEFQHRW
jgi:hypothetical protein